MMLSIQYYRQLFLLALLCSLIACNNDSSTTDPQVTSSLQTQYFNAVEDARTVEAYEISYDLTPITEDNPNLIWENGVVGSRLLVVTWLDDAGQYYKCSNPGGCSGNTSCIEGGECPNYKWDSWVTVVPEMKTFFSMTQPDPLRIAQLLGLPPEVASVDGSGGYKYMLEMWVSPQDLFRPCPDTEISDSVCETELPINSPMIPDKIMATSGPDYGAFMAYPDWFNNQTHYTYTLDSDPYPWTRLGYTYDWGSLNHVGLSEFVLHGRKEDDSGISVGIKSVKTTTEYFEE
jgi:hypothetical protein